MKNKKIITFIIIVISILTLFIIFSVSKKDNVKLSKEENVENSVNEGLENEIITANITDENLTLANEIVENTSTDETFQSPVVAINSSTEKPANTSTKQPSQSSSSSQSIALNKETQTVQTPSVEVSSTPATTPTIQTPVPVETKPVEEPSKPVQNVESFRVNNSMIETIRNVINNNPSDTMKQYGYTVVVDSSIVNTTNEFTYTETRVKNAVKFSFGTIKIYARDYLVNGEYRWTESFIL